jgi:hypothetical protein
LGGDDGVLDNKLPWCFPLMPKHFSVQPKNNETVLILTFSRDKQHTDRLHWANNLAISKMGLILIMVVV